MGPKERLVLIVDDSPEDREAVRRSLTRDKQTTYRFTEVSSGVEGLRACRETLPDCLLLDYDLPDLDGLQFLAALTTTVDQFLVPVVMLTGRGGEAIAVQALKHGAQDYLVKGAFSPEILQRTVADAIERVAIRRELNRQRQELERLYDEARDGDRRKDEFLAMLAHELRNPLAPILNALHVMKLQVGDTSTIERMRAMIEQQVHHLSRLVEDLLDVSRITRGKIQLRTERGDLSEIVVHAVEYASSSIEQHQQKLTVKLPEGPVPIEADPTRIGQILSNLLSNASKYTDPGGSIFLTVELVGDEVTISVRDTGIGISPEMLPHVFDLFAQADHSLDRSQGGLGIGLTLVRSLVQMHGGQVEVRSDGLGQGSEFTVRLPAADGTIEPQKPAEEVIPRKNGSQRVLVVDDNVHAAESLSIILKLWDHDARVAYTGPEAIKLADEFSPEIVLLDIGLPGMDGYSVAEVLRSRPHLAQVRLIAMTGYGRDEDLQRSSQAGFDHHLVKPIDFGILEALLNETGRAK